MLRLLQRSNRVSWSSCQKSGCTVSSASSWRIFLHYFKGQSHLDSIARLAKTNKKDDFFLSLFCCGAGLWLLWDSTRESSDFVWDHCFCTSWSDTSWETVSGPIVFGSSLLFYAEGVVESLWSIDQYFEFVLVLMFSTGLSFQVCGSENVLIYMFLNIHLHLDMSSCVATGFV